MDIAKVKETFEFVLDSWRKSQILQEKARSYRLSATGGGIRYDKDRVQTSPDDYQSRWIIAAADCEAEAVRTLALSDEARQKVYDWVEAYCSDEEQYVLVWHYINGKSYNEIKEEYIELFDYRVKSTMYNIAQRGIAKIADNLKS
jgi:hypothetical protein